MNANPSMPGPDSRILFPEYSRIELAIGDVRHRNIVQEVDKIALPDSPFEGYAGMFRFQSELDDLVKNKGSVEGSNQFPCYSDFLWFDIDDQDPEQARIRAIELVLRLETSFQIKADQLAIFFSGNKGFHIGIPSVLFGVSPSQNLPGLFKRVAIEIAQDIKIDTAIYESNRLWRIPNTLNFKSGLFKIRLSYEQLASLEINKIRELAKKPAGSPYICFPSNENLLINERLKALVADIGREPDEINNPENHIPPQNPPGWIADKLRKLQPGNRNNTLFQVGCRLIHDGWTAADIIALLEPHALRAGFPADELYRLVEEACHRYPPDISSPFSNIYIEKRGTGSHELKAVRLVDFLGEKETPLEWRVDKLFPREGVAIIAGPAGYGKSWMLSDLALACTSDGGKWLDQFETLKGRVLYIDEESSESLLRHRFNKLLKHIGIGATDLDLHLVVGQGFSFGTNGGVDNLRRLLRDLRPDVVIIDSLIRVHNAEENSASEMSRVFAQVKDLVREFSNLIVFADHQRKPGPSNNTPDMLLRGTTEKAAFIDTLLSLQQKNGNLIVTHSKSRFAQAVPSFILQIKDTTPDSTAVTYGGEAEGMIEAMRLEEAMEFVESALAGGEWLSRKQLIQDASEAGIPRNAVDESLRILLDQGVLQKEKRNPETGKGGKLDWYRRLDISSPSPTIYTEETETNSEPRDI